MFERGGGTKQRYMPRDSSLVWYGMVITYSKGKDQTRKVANPARGQLNREKKNLPVRVRA